MADLYCTHNRITGQCEDCAFVGAVERGHESVRVLAASLDNPDRAPHNDGDRRQAVTADRTVWIERPDVPGSYVLVRQGDIVPAHLVDAARQTKSPSGSDRSAATAPETTMRSSPRAGRK